MKVLLVVLVLLLIVAGALHLWYRHDESLRRDAWDALLALPVPTGNGESLPGATRSGEPLARNATSHYLPDDLPPLARRYLTASIRPGTPRRTRAVIRMHGEFRLGDAAAPRAFPMQARQLLAPPHGFIWQVSMGSGLMRLAGSDGATPATSWTRFWLAGLVPLVRAGGTADHALSSFGRYMSEAILWTPAAVLPSDTVRWEDIDATTTRVTVTAHGHTQAFDLTLDDDGQPQQIVFQRWTDANPDKRYQRQPFGGTLNEFRWIDGYRVPTRIEAGNFFGTDDYFPFFSAVIDAIDYR